MTELLLVIDMDSVSAVVAFVSVLVLSLLWLQRSTNSTQFTTALQKSHAARLGRRLTPPAAPPPAPAALATIAAEYDDDDEQETANNRNGESQQKAATAAADAELLELLNLHSLRAEERHFLSEATRVRYLKDSRNDVERASQKIRRTLAWRASFLGDAIRDAHKPLHCAHCARDPDSHCFLSLGPDRRGWQLLYCCPARGKYKAAEEQMRHMCLCLEAAFDRGAAPGRFRWLIDLRGMGLADMDPRVASGAAPMLMQHQLGRLGQAVLLDAPPLFQAFWRTVSPLLDAASASRFHFLTRAEQDGYFEEHLTAAQARFVQAVLQTRAAPGAFPPGFERTAFRVVLPDDEGAHGAADAEAVCPPCSSSGGTPPGGAPRSDEAIITGTKVPGRGLCQAPRHEAIDAVRGQSPLGALCGSLARCLPVSAA